MYRDKPCNIFVTYLWALKQLTSFYISIFLFGKSSFDIFYKNQWGSLNTAFATFWVITRKNLEIRGKVQELLKRIVKQENFLKTWIKLDLRKRVLFLKNQKCNICCSEVQLTYFRSWIKQNLLSPKQVIKTVGSVWASKGSFIGDL